MPRRLTLLPICCLALAAACARGGAAAGPASAPSPARAAADSASGPDAPGARWYGYEGGLKEAEASARAIEGASKFWTSREGRWRADSAAGSYTAFDDGRWVRRLQVATDSGARRGTGAFTYDERGRLYYFGGEWRIRVGRGARARTDRVVVSVAMNRAGNVGAASRTVNGRAQPLSAAEVAWILAVERAARTAAGSAAGR